ncbi:two-component regulator propeller domain-containing protein [Limibacter armeniacum]|uniref:hybrid sensor histidine kinase/response regulator transcription factor n=1 Tax=Limibacter armeniacum TaxID=466084 RepID=UPI002FE5B584
MRFYFYLLFLLFAFCRNGYAYYLTENINKKAGLSNGSIHEIIQDAQGFIWIGTKNGLNRYDGLNFKIYNKQNSLLNGSDISSLLIDHKGTIWVGTIDGGLHLYNQEKDQFSTIYNKELPQFSSNIEIHDLHEDQKGTLWIGTNVGLFAYDTSADSLIQVQCSLQADTKQDSNIQTITSDANHNVWIGTNAGNLFKYDMVKGNCQQVDIPAVPEHALNRILHLTFYDEHHLLIATRGAGLLVMDIANQQLTPLLPELLSNSAIVVQSLMVDSQKNIWIGTDGKGVIQAAFDSQNNTLTVLLSSDKESHDIAGDAIYSIFEDRDHNIWVGTAWNGISVLEANKEEISLLDGNRFNMESLPTLSINQFGKSMWIGTDGKGLLHYNTQTNQYKLFNHDNQKLDAKYVQCISEMGNGNLLIGSFSNGLIVIHPVKGQVKKYTHLPNTENTLSHNDVRNIVADSLGNYWITTWGGGLNYFNPKKGSFITYKHNPQDSLSLSNDNTISISRSKNGKLWISTFGGGINLFDPIQQTFKHFQNKEDDPNSISSNNVVSILEDKRGQVWIGTWGHGVNRLNPATQAIERFENVKLLQGKSIMSITEDKHGNIWFGTKEGILKYDRKSDSFLSHPKLDGEYHINSVFKSPNGTLLFGGLNGIISFNPDNISFDFTPPAVRLTDFKLFNKSVPVGEDSPLKKSILYAKNIVLEYNQSVVTFEFTSLGFPATSDCEYAIKLKNFDKDWRYIGKDRTATYTNLSPGDYEFQVKAQTKEGKFGNKYTAVGLTVLKPYWATWYAYLFYAAVIVMLLALFRRYTLRIEKIKSQLQIERVTREKEQELHDIKQRFFTNISHEIRTPITLILGSINRLNEGDLTRKEQSLNILQKNSQYLLNLVNALLDFRKLESQEVILKYSNADMVHFTKDIFDSFLGLAEEKNIHFHFVTDQAELPVWFDNKEMEKVIYNLLDNAFKYTDDGGDITVEISHDQTYATIKVIDSGKGIPTKKLQHIFKRFYQLPDTESGKGFGIGLSIVQDVVALHHGKVKVENREGQGSIFSIKLLLGNSHIPMEQRSDLPDSKPITTPTNVSLSEMEDRTVMLVEDNAEIRAYVEEILAPYFKLITAADGQEALDSMKENLPDLIISDVMMPVMDGMELTKNIKSNIKTSHIPVILLTAKDADIYKQEGFEEGADAYVTKPFDESLLKARIKSLLHNRELIAEKYRNELLIKPAELPINSPDQQFLKDITQILETNIAEGNLTIDFFIKEMGMSHSVIYKKLKALTGMSFVEFARDFRLKRAAQLITQHKMNITEACYQVGFSDRRYFSQVFKQKFGMTPSEYKKTNSVTEEGH